MPAPSAIASTGLALRSLFWNPFGVHLVMAVAHPGFGTLGDIGAVSSQPGSGLHKPMPGMAREPNASCGTPRGSGRPHTAPLPEGRRRQGNAAAVRRTPARGAASGIWAGSCWFWRPAQPLHHADLGDLTTPWQGVGETARLLIAGAGVETDRVERRVEVQPVEARLPGHLLQRAQERRANA